MDQVSRANTTVVFIGGAGHSGSTLLGLILGTHPAVFYAGEAQKSIYLDNPQAPQRARMCRLCGPDCPVWGALRVADGRELYETLSQHTGRPVVVDSAKPVPWIEQQSGALRGVVPVHLIVLSRDGRAVVNSRARKYPEVTLRRHVADWKMQMRATEELASRWEGGRVCRVRYEELATDPDTVVRRLCSVLGIGFRAGMLDPWSSEHHPLSGNDGTQSLLRRPLNAAQHRRVAPAWSVSPRSRAWYADHPGGIRLDLRWKSEMSAEALATFEKVAGQANRPYAWEPGEGPLTAPGSHERRAEPLPP
ncbi:sulfotransferase family protein [Streptomyces alanosinicus]|uniref:Sulfotransferase n=1 Tax=Streptomyces alanosinicus TaxID=68171 RepID=A0A919D194_9ACTN|nr:sulfotransferase [Streptomyces alanosinicus]GHE02831.1 hypothetical protein GCM10010339_27560 [Streptomyces alanosinicus]